MRSYPRLISLIKATNYNLPKHFYNYLNKEACPGCYGCDEDFEFPPDYGNEKQEEYNNQSLEETNLVIEEKEEIEEQPVNMATADTSTSTGAGLFSTAAIGFSSFSDLASGTDRPSDFNIDKDFKFAGAGAQLFASRGGEEGEEREGTENPEEEANIHFKPIVTLPDSYEYKSGEEGGKVLFDERGKLYRFDFPTNQWKERGIGNMKIVYYHGNGQTRLLMRRDQILKICCNHYITSNMSIETHMGSPKAMTWFTQVDYSEETSLPQKLAIRFKHEETAGKFRELFEDAVKKANEIHSKNQEEEEEEEENNEEEEEQNNEENEEEEEEEQEDQNNEEEEKENNEEEEERDEETEDEEEDETRWICPDCSHKNEITVNKCETCEAIRKE